MGNDPQVTVLLVEDDEGDADLVEVSLSETKSPVLLLRASRLETALEQLKSQPIDVVLLDLSLPDTFELRGLTRIREAAPEVPVLVLTGSTDDRLSARAFTQGAQDFLRKGEVDGHALALAIRHARERQTHLSRAKWLADAGQKLSASLDYQQTLANLVSAVVPSFADSCIVELQAEPDSYRREPPRAALYPELQAAFEKGATVDHSRRETEPAVATPLRVGERTIGAVRFGWKKPQEEHVVPTCEEVARRAALALENAQLLRRAREAVALREEFLSVASHELRTPLSTLRMQVEILRRVQVDESTLRQQLPARLDSIARQAQRLTRLIEVLLDVSSIANGQLKLLPEPLDLVELARDALSRFSAAAESLRSPIHLECDAAVRGTWDKLRMDQVFENLISNALKYGHGKPIIIAVRRQRDCDLISVRDAGIGIAAVDIERIFGRFERAASVRHYGGLGLGLFVTRQIVEAHGGTIGVESMPGNGSQFAVRLPRDSPARLEGAG